VLDRFTQKVFGLRLPLLILFALASLVLGYFATQLRIDAGFEKQLPLKHPFVQSFLEYQEEFGGGDRVLFALHVKNGSIYQAESLRSLKALTDEVFFLPGINRSSVTSLFTPNVRFIEIVEGGFAGGNVVPADFDFSNEAIQEVQENVLKAGIVGRLVSSDFRSAIISAELVEIDAQTQSRLDYLEVSKRLESLRTQFETENTSIHIIGFAKAVGDIADGATSVAIFFVISFLITAVLVFYFTQSIVLGMLPLICSSLAVLWTLGGITLLGFGLDPMSMLVPFLIFAIGVSHGVQMINGIGSELYSGKSLAAASQMSFRKLILPGGIALASDTLGFLLILLIEIQMIQELAIMASLGVGFIILTNLLILPLLASGLRIEKNYVERLRRSAEKKRAFWTFLSRFATRSWGIPTVVVSFLLAALCFPLATQVKIGDLQEGVPELRQESRYNQDTAFITNNFSIGVDVFTVIVEGEPNACIDDAQMEEIDRFQWELSQVAGVQSTLSLPQVARLVNAGWNEGHPAWRVLPQSSEALVQSISGIETSTGLLNSDCSAMPVMIFGEDHRAETIDRIVKAVKDFSSQASGKLSYRLASGNMGIMAATNEVVGDAQFSMLFLIYAAVFLLCWASFGSIRASLCIIIPLSLVSIWGYALMSFLDIGLKVSTLPVAALGVGIGVDYGIYIFSRLKGALKRSSDGNLQEAFVHTLQVTGNAVLITGLTLSIGVSTWIFSALKFQADMGLLLSFMFLMNMLGAILILPALASLFFRAKLR
jgi:predicted RND superfamily exporter protein